uniref:Secreted protein n=1 Tax=Mus musculus TaxID=10090 RepID=Q3UUA1_MOUSE|nr:unnamed protein product [Mus musculus]
MPRRLFSLLLTIYRTRAFTFLFPSPTHGNVFFHSSGGQVPSTSDVCSSVAAWPPLTLLPAECLNPNSLYFRQIKTAGCHPWPLAWDGNHPLFCGIPPQT